MKCLFVVFYSLLAMALFAQEDSLYLQLNTQAGKAAFYGKHQDAIELYESVLTKAVEHNLPPQNFQYRLALDKLAAYASLKKEYLKAIQYYERLLFAESTLTENKIMTQRDLLARLAYICSKAKKYKKAQEYYQQRLELLDKNTPDYIDALYAVGLMSAKQPTELKTAVSIFKKVVQLQKKQTPNDIVKIAQKKRSLGIVYQKQAKYAQSEHIYNDILATLEETEQAVILEKAIVWRCLGELYEVQDDVKRAENWYKKALDLSMTQLGKNSPRLTPILERLAIFYEHTGELQKGIDLRWRILFLYNDQCFSKSEVRQRTIDALVALYKKIGDLDGVEAVQQFTEVCSIAH